MDNIKPVVINQFSLFFSEGSSDKEYHAQIVSHPDGHRVLFRYGRRGGALAHGEKTTAPVELEAASKIFEKLRKEKMNKGYTPDVSGAAYEGHEKAGLTSGITLDLLTKTTESELSSFLHDDDYFLQQKIDGERRAVTYDNQQAQGINKQNLLTPMPTDTADALVNLITSKLTGRFMVDAEIVGQELHLFDIHEFGGHPIKGQHGPLARFDILEKIFEGNTSPLLHLVRTARTYDEKVKLLEDIKAHDLEGVAIKHKARDGDLFKFKFYEECSVEVLSLNAGKRSVEVGIKNVSGEVYSVGNVTIPVNKNIPMAGDILEVKYLYAYEGGSLYQPTYHRPRPDITSADTDSVLKYKPKSQSMRP